MSEPANYEAICLIRWPQRMSQELVRTSSQLSRAGCLPTFVSSAGGREGGAELWYAEGRKLVKQSDRTNGGLVARESVGGAPRIGRNRVAKETKNDLRRGAQGTRRRRKSKQCRSGQGKGATACSDFVGERDAWCRLWHTQQRDLGCEELSANPTQRRDGWMDGRRRDGGRDTQTSKAQAPELSPGTADNSLSY
ncbi:hypothetical protein LIA77_08834 [Sarocladium implicatum]|nr:hypothetical protein LIA77_08834 [Sarocladium implicatum]